MLHLMCQFQFQLVDLSNCFVFYSQSLLITHTIYPFCESRAGCKKLKYSQLSKNIFCTCSASAPKTPRRHSPVVAVSRQRQRVCSLASRLLGMLLGVLSLRWLGLLHLLCLPAAAPPPPSAAAPLLHQICMVARVPAACRASFGSSQVTIIASCCQLPHAQPSPLHACLSSCSFWAKCMANGLPTVGCKVYLQIVCVNCSWVCCLHSPPLPTPSGNSPSLSAPT